MEVGVLPLRHPPQWHLGQMRGLSPWACPWWSQRSSGGLLPWAMAGQPLKGRVIHVSCVPLGKAVVSLVLTCCICQVKGIWPSQGPGIWSFLGMPGWGVALEWALRRVWGLPEAITVPLVEKVVKSRPSKDQKDRGFLRAWGDLWRLCWEIWGNFPYWHLCICQGEGEAVFRLFWAGDHILIITCGSLVTCPYEPLTAPACLPTG